MESFEEMDRFLTALSEHIEKYGHQIIVKEMVDGRLRRVPLSTLSAERLLMHIDCFVRNRVIPLRLVS